MLDEALKATLGRSTHHRELLEVMDYAVRPAGKLFRPRLVQALGLDLKKSFDQQDLHLACAIELHHAYTLVHDDLPAMDNDLIRRGKPSTHAHYGEWKAILAGDALLIASYEELMRIEHPCLKELHRLFTWATGAKGLICGQYMDLKADGNFDLHHVVRIHELKTARLIQVATLGTKMLSKASLSLREKIIFLRLGREIGVSFQLLDDLSELAENEVSEHEKLINPFISSTDSALAELQKSHQRLMKILTQHKLSHLEEMLRDYFKKNQQNLLENFVKLENNVGEDKLAGLKNWLTSFV